MSYVRVLSCLPSEERQGGVIVLSSVHLAFAFVLDLLWLAPSTGAVVVCRPCRSIDRPTLSCRRCLPRSPRRRRPRSSSPPGSKCQTTGRATAAATTGTASRCVCVCVCARESRPHCLRRAGCVQTGHGIGFASSAALHGTGFAPIGTGVLRWSLEAVRVKLPLLCASSARPVNDGSIDPAGGGRCCCLIALRR